MKQHLIRTVAVLAAVCITFGSVGLRDEIPAQNRVYAKTVSEIEQEKKEKQAEIESKQAELDALKADISKHEEYQQALSEQIDLINSKLTLIDGQLQSLGSEISEKQSAIADLEVEIADQQTEIDKELSDFKARIRTLYVHGNDSLISALVGATDFYDVLAKIDLIKRIGRHDDDMMKQLQAHLRELSENQQSLNQAVQTLTLRQTEMEAVHGEFSDSRAALDAAMEQSDTAKAELEKKHSAAEQALGDAAAEIEDLEAEEEALILEAAKKAAEEAKKKAEAEAKKKAEEEAKKKAAEEAKKKAAEESRRAATATTTATTTTTKATTAKTTAKTTASTTKATTAKTTAKTTASTTKATTTKTTAKTTASTTKATTTKATTKATTATTKATTVTTTVSTTTTTVTTPAPPSTGGVLAWPAPGFYHISSPFGWRWGRQHKGIDISGGGINGANACAAAGGTVIKAKMGYNGGYGNYVQIDHGNGMNTLYAHLQSLNVSVGQQVSTGTVVGKIGSTGNSTGPHLHFSVIIDGTFVDPMGYLY